LKERCLSGDTGSRPLFDEIASVLRRLTGTGDQDAAALMAV
jgi:hypothetical protein